jgi:hypothetical protein
VAAITTSLSIARSAATAAAAIHAPQARHVIHAHFRLIVPPDARGISETPALFRQTANDRGSTMENTKAHAVVIITGA